MVLNKKLIKNIGILLLALLFLIGMLFLPTVSVHFAFLGLKLWFTKMIPTLFPFMIISGILIRLDLVRPLCTPLKRLFAGLFGVDEHGAFCILTGFLCGFPMGAKVIADLYKKGDLTLEDAEYLLSFSNNIGPVYFCGYVLTTLQIKEPLPFLFGMYGIPLLYGMLYYRIRKYACFFPYYKKKSLIFHMAEEKEASSGCLEAVDNAIVSGIESITKLGGYMVFFNVFNMLPRLLMQKGLAASFSYETRVRITYFLSCLFEISNGVNLVKNKEPWLILTMIPFGGMCCMAQTYSLIKETPLSLAKYGMHKLLLTILTAGYLFILSRFIRI